MKVFFNALLVHLIFNIYVFIRGWITLPPKRTYRVPYALVFIIELIIYLIGYFGNVNLPSQVLKPVLLIGTSWMVFIGYMTALLVIYDILKLSSRWINFIARIGLYELKKKRVYFIASFLVVVAAMGYGNYRFFNPIVKEYNLSIDKEANNIDNLRVVMVADLHLGYLIDKEILHMYVDKIMEQKPDIILMVGDIIDYDLDPIIDQQMEEEFHRLSAPYGIYASTGNHEYRLNAEEKIAWLSQKTGMTVLRDEAIKVNDSFYLIGREDDECLTRKKISELTNNLDHSYPIIVINHEPKRLSEESGEKVDLALYGHTHNGQLFPYNIVMSWIYEVGYGYKKKDSTHVYVTSGLGLSGPQYRIGTISEIVVMNLKFNKK